MKLGILSQWFDPEPGPAAIPGVIAREFVRAGHEVSVLTGFPNYPTGKIYPEFKQSFRNTTDVGGVHVTRVPLHPSHDSSSLGRLVNYGSFAATATALGHRAMAGVDAMWVYNSPITVTLPLLTHSRWGRIPYFLQVQDLWPDSLIDSGMFPGGSVGKAAAAAISGVVRLSENRAGIIGVSSLSARELLLSRNPKLSEERVVFSPNPTDEVLFRPIGSLAPSEIPSVPWADKFTLMYVGAVGEVQGLDSLVDAATLLRDHENIHIAVVGDGIARDRLEARAVERGLSNITFVGRVEKQFVPGYIATASVQLVSLADRAFLNYTTPSKIASLLASEVPIIGQLPGDGARLIAEAGAGVLAEPEDGDSLAEAVVRMSKLSSTDIAGFGRSGRTYYLENISAEVVAKNVVMSLQNAGL